MGPNQYPVTELRLRYPCWTVAQIAEKVGLSRQRVDQILRSSKLPIGAKRQQRYKYQCQDCGKQLRAPTKSNRCKECSKTQTHLPIVCDWCGKLLERMQWHYIKRGYQHAFCNHSCQGRWLATNYGFKKGHKSVGGGHKKHDYNLVWSKHLETGYGAVKLGRLLNIPPSSVNYILNRMRKQGLKSGNY